LIEFAIHVDFTTVQIDAALHDDETETRARTFTDVTAAIERIEEPLSVGF
jgi:hypothetical protein